MLPWICGRQTLTIVVSTPCMTQAQMTVAVIAPRLGTGGALSPLTASRLRRDRRPALRLVIGRGGCGAGWRASRNKGNSGNEESAMAIITSNIAT